MAHQRLPESIQTLYAELLEQSIHAEAEAAAIGALHGTFVSKTIKGGTYWYLQRMEGDRKRQHYLGRESAVLLDWMEKVRQVRARSAADDAQQANLVSMLAAGGATTESASIIKVLLLLAESGVFRMGGVLVGTQAFAAYGNMLGIRFEMDSLRTQDIDIAQDRAIGIALFRKAGTTNVQRSLTDSGFEPNQPSTSFKIRGRDFWVDFLTPLIGCESAEPVFLPALGVAAHPLWFLEYLIENPAQAVVIGGFGILVNVPDPARFALHKLLISEGRSVSEQATKDRRQAGDLLEVLLEDRPADLTVAWEALARNVSAVRTVRTAIGRLSPDLQDRLKGLLFS